MLIMKLYIGLCKVRGTCLQSVKRIPVVCSCNKQTDLSHSPRNMYTRKGQELVYNFELFWTQIREVQILQYCCPTVVPHDPSHNWNIYDIMRQNCPFGVLFVSCVTTCHNPSQLTMTFKYLATKILLQPTKETIIANWRFMTLTSASSLIISVTRKMEAARSSKTLKHYHCTVHKPKIRPPSQLDCFLFYLFSSTCYTSNSYKISSLFCGQSVYWLLFREI